MNRLGTVKNLRTDRGFGFIAAEDGTSIFFHASALPDERAFEELLVGDQVEFESAVTTPKGPRADTVRRLNPAPSPEAA